MLTWIVEYQGVSTTMIINIFFVKILQHFKKINTIRTNNVIMKSG